MNRAVWRFGVDFVHPDEMGDVGILKSPGKIQLNFLFFCVYYYSDYDRDLDFVCCLNLIKLSVHYLNESQNHFFYFSLLEKVLGEYDYFYIVKDKDLIVLDTPMGRKAYMERVIYFRTRRLIFWLYYRWLPFLGVKGYRVECYFKFLDDVTVLFSQDFDKAVESIVFYEVASADGIVD